MDVINYLQTEMNKHLTKARAIADAADAEGRGLSEVERKEAESELAEVAELKSRLSDEQDKARLRDLVDGWDNLQSSVIDPNPVREPAEVARAKTLGDAFINSDGFKMMQAKYKASGSLPEKSVSPAVDVPWRFKAAGDPVLESDSTDIFGTGGNAGSLTTFLGVQPPLQYRLTIADLLGNIPVTVGNSVTYPVVDTRTQVSGTPQTEGSAKPGGEYVFGTDTKVLVTLAGWVKVSTQFLEDAPGLAAYINSDLPFQIRQNEEAYLAAALLAGCGLSANGTGLQTTPNGFDAIQEAISLIAINGGEATGLIISPTDWATLLTTKFEGAATQYDYIGGGPFTPTNNPWGLRVVVTPAATDGLPIVGDFNMAAKVYRRGGLTLASSNSDQDDFVKNLVTIRAEERLVIGITYTYLLATAVIGTS